MENTVVIKKRIGYYDTIRLIAALWVYTTHYIAFFNDDYFKYWNIYPYSIVLNGLSGKFAVAAFGIILGFFACKKGNKKGSVIHYTVSRYLYFVLAGLTANILYAAAGYFGLINNYAGPLEVVKISLVLGKDLMSHFWCMRDFLFASVICFINGKYKLNFVVILMEMAILWLLEKQWISICLLGGLMAVALQKKFIQNILKNKKVQIVALILIYMVIKGRPSSMTTYLIHGICTCIFIMVVTECSVLQKVLNVRAFTTLGKYSMGIYLIHPLIYKIFGELIINRWEVGSFKFRFLIGYVVCLVLILAVSKPLTDFIGWLQNKIMGGIEWLADIVYIQRVK